MKFRETLPIYRLFKVLLCVVLIIILSGLKTHAQSAINVTLRVGPSDIRFSGYTSPQATIIFRENGGTIGTSVSDENGQFSRLFEDLDPGIHTISIYSVDQDGVTSSTLTYNLAVTLGTTTEVNNIIIPPTLSVSDSTINTNESVVISGMGVPGSNIQIFLNNLPLTTTTSGISGRWSYTVNASDTEVGENSLSASAEYLGTVSDLCISVVVNVSAIPSTGDDEGDDDDDDDHDGKDRGESGPSSFFEQTVEEIVSEITNPLLKLFPFIDKNLSGTIELDELYDAMKAWVDNWRAENTENCDLNGDGFCNIIDWSIALYFINR